MTLTKSKSVKINFEQNKKVKRSDKVTTFSLTFGTNFGMCFVMWLNQKDVAIQRMAQGMPGKRVFLKHEVRLGFSVSQDSVRFQRESLQKESEVIFEGKLLLF